MGVFPGRRPVRRQTPFLRDQRQERMRLRVSDTVGDGSAVLVLRSSRGGAILPIGATGLLGRTSAPPSPDCAHVGLRGDHSRSSSARPTDRNSPSRRGSALERPSTRDRDVVLSRLPWKVVWIRLLRSSARIASPSPPPYLPARVDQARAAPPPRAVACQSRRRSLTRPRTTGQCRIASSSDGPSTSAANVSRLGGHAREPIPSNHRYEQTPLHQHGLKPKL